jgi:dolichol-phosphate mannosyltransferase
LNGNLSLNQNFEPVYNLAVLMNMNANLGWLISEPTGECIIPALRRLPPDQHPLWVSLVIPTFNEGENIQKLLITLIQLFEQAIPGRYELIVVDDDSPDRTWEIAQSLIPTYPGLRVMRRQQERGLSSAVVRGWQVARGEILGVIDGDLQHPPATLLQLLAAIAEGADLAVASRHVEGGGVSDWGLIRRCLSRGAQLLGLLLLPKVVGRVSDPMSGYFLLQRTAIAEKTLNPMGYKILLEVLGKGEIKEIAEVGYVFQEREQGNSKVTWKQYLEYVTHLIQLRSQGRLSQFRYRYQLPVTRFLRFALVGFSGVFVDMAIFFLLNDPHTLAWGLTRSKVIAAQTAIFNNFMWNDQWTFSDLSRRQPGGAARLRRFLKFNLICLSGLVLNILILNLLFNVFQINRYLANLTAIALVTLWNFWFNLKLGWRVTKVK